MEEMMDGSWVDDPSQIIGYRELMGDDEPYLPSDHVWAPHSCSLTLYKSQQLQLAFQGQHLFFVGDSTMFELMEHIILFFGYDISLATKPSQECGYHDRAFDSGHVFPVRFSFDWAAHHDICGNHGGLVDVFRIDQGKRFLDSIPETADFIIVNTGHHDVSSGKDLHDYEVMLEKVLDHLSRRVRGAERMIWRTTSPRSKGGRDCQESKKENHDGNAGVAWVNVLGAKRASAHGLPIFDVQRIWSSEDYQRLREPGATSNSVDGDGLHCLRVCPKCFIQSIILLHYLMQISDPPSHQTTTTNATMLKSPNE